MDELPSRFKAVSADAPLAAAEVLPLVYDELRRLAAHRLAQEAPGQTLQPTALVHEAYLRLVIDGADRHWDGRRHFFAAAAEAMRRILVDNARRKRRVKRGGRWQRQDLDPDQFHASAESDDLLALHEALERLTAADPQVAELVTLRYFAGLSLPEVAATLGISLRTAERWWAYARAWLLGELEDGDEKFRPGGQEPSGDGAMPSGNAQ
jgi:RNA polymerase sigma factor (TIGR02999 family)